MSYDYWLFFSAAGLAFKIAFALLDGEQQLEPSFLQHSFFVLSEAFLAGFVWADTAVTDAAKAKMNNVFFICLFL